MKVHYLRMSGTIVALQDQQVLLKTLQPALGDCPWRGHARVQAGVGGRG